MLQSAIAIFEELAQSHPDEARHHGSLGRSYNTLGWIRDELRDNVEAIPAFEAAVHEQERAIARSPDDDEYKVLLSIHLENLGEQYVDLGQVDRGLPYYMRGIEIRRQLSRAHPEIRAYLIDLAEAMSTMGNVQRHAGDSAAARDSFSEARILLQRGAVATPGDEGLRIRLGAALIREARALADLGEPGKAQPLLESAVKSLSDTTVSSAEEARRRESLSEALWELACILRVSRETGEAAGLDGRRVALWRDRPPGKLAALALEQASAAAIIGYGRGPVPPSALRVRDLDLDQAAANLRLAIARGFRDLAMLQSHPDSQILLSREDLRLLIMDMAFPDRPFGNQ